MRHFQIHRYSLCPRTLQNLEKCESFFQCRQVIKVFKETLDMIKKSPDFKLIDDFTVERQGGKKYRYILGTRDDHECYCLCYPDNPSEGYSMAILRNPQDETKVAGYLEILGEVIREVDEDWQTTLFPFTETTSSCA